MKEQILLIAEALRQGHISPKEATAIKVVKIPEAAQEILKLIQHENQ